MLYSFGLSDCFRKEKINEQKGFEMKKRIANKGMSILPIGISIIIFFVCVQVIFAQEGAIKGKIIDEKGKGLANVKITLYDDTRGLKFETKTDNNGKFYKRGLAPTTYTITLELEGYYPIKDTLRVRVGKPEEMEIVMKAAAPEILGGEDFINGSNLFKEGKYAEAIEAFKKVIENLPDYEVAHHNLGLSYLRNGSLDEAIGAFNKAIELKPDMIEAYFGLGECYIKKQESDKALEVFSKTTEIQPDNPKLYYNLGVIYYNNDQTDEAIAAFEKSSALDPKFSSTHYQLGLAYFKKENPDKAIEHFEKFLALEPNAPEAPQVKEIIEVLKKQKEKTL